MLNRIKTIFSRSSNNNQFGVALRSHIGSFAIRSKDGSSAVDEYFTETTETVGDWLEQLLAEQKVAGEGYLVLSGNHYHNVQINKPDLPDDEIPAALKWLVKDIVPIEPDDMIVDYYDSPVVVAGIQKINVICCHLSHLKKFTDSFKRYQNKLLGIITDEFAFANLIEDSTKPVMLLCQQPFEDVFLIIVFNGQIYLSRRLRGFNELGGYSEQQLSEGICDALSVELQKSMDYFERQLKQAPINEIKVLLPIKHEQFVVEKLNRNANIDVSLLPLPESFEHMRAAAASVGGMMELQKAGAEDE